MALQKVNTSHKICTVVIDGLELEYLLTCQKQKEGQKLKQDILEDFDENSQNYQLKARLNSAKRGTAKNLEQKWNCPSKVGK